MTPPSYNAASALSAEDRLLEALCQRRVPPGGAPGPGGVLCELHEDRHPGRRSWWSPPELEAAAEVSHSTASGKFQRFHEVEGWIERREAPCGCGTEESLYAVAAGVQDPPGPGRNVSCVAYRLTAAGAEEAGRRGLPRPTRPV